MLKLVSICLTAIFIATCSISNAQEQKNNSSVLIKPTIIQDRLDDLESPTWSIYYSYGNPDNVNGYFKINMDTILRHHKFIPYVEREIELWLCYCPILSKGHMQKRVYNHILFNLDAKSYRVLNSSNPRKIYYIEPNSVYENAIKKAEEFY